MDYLQLHFTYYILHFYYELLPNSQMINSEKHCSQLNELKIAIEQKHQELANQKAIVFHQENMRPHVSLTT